MWGPEVGKTTLDLKKPIREKLRGRRETPSSKGPIQVHLRWISARGCI